MRTKWRRFYAQTYTTHNSTSNITYWHIYLNKFLTNQNNMWRTFFFRKCVMLMFMLTIFPTVYLWKRKILLFSFVSFALPSFLEEKKRKNFLRILKGIFFAYMKCSVGSLGIFGWSWSELVIEETHLSE